jgi:ABC-type dipeptide/oligopeptide/nickel transport system permease subunit
MKKKLITFLGLGLMLAPFAVFAQGTTPTVSCAAGYSAGGIEAVICKIGSILNIIIPILIVLGVVYFVWGIVTYVISDDEEAKKAGTQRMIYGIIGLVVIVGMWGLVRIVTNTFGLDNNAQNIETPCVPGTPGCY